MRASFPAARSLTTHAYAKINLGFEVLGRHPDGLHEVSSILQTIDLADRLVFARSDRISLRCTEMEVSPDNLILQAAYLLREHAGVSRGCEIECHKRIPVSAGLGGGSADGAATLRALESFWDLNVDEAMLGDLAARLGADVPFCLFGGTALATGTGRVVEWLPDAPVHWVVLVPLTADDPAKTANMYGRLRESQWSDGGAVRRQEAAIRSGNLDYSAVRSAFTAPARDTWPAAGGALEALEGSGALAASVSGAGPSAFGLFGSRADANRAAEKVRIGGLPVRVQKFTGPVA